MDVNEVAIEVPRPNDVLCGRGNGVNAHPGNIYFRSIVDKVKKPYIATPKAEKPKFSTKILTEINNLNPPGRFLKQDPTTKRWFVLGEKKTLIKIRQALREGAPKIQMETKKTESYDSDVSVVRNV